MEDWTFQSMNHGHRPLVPLPYRPVLRSRVPVQTIASLEKVSYRDLHVRICYADMLRLLWSRKQRQHKRSSSPTPRVTATDACAVTFTGSKCGFEWEFPDTGTHYGLD
ncbi:hypothetical protein CBL_09140 [Carabus blaptoides fortunei]